MSEDTDKESKTEEATEKKVADAIEKGNTPHSREIGIFASMLAILTLFILFIPGQVAELTGMMARFIDDPGDFRLSNGSEASRLLWAVSLGGGRFIFPAVVLLGLAGIAASLFQNAPSLVLERIRPQASRISIKKGWGRIFGKQGNVEFLKQMAKLLAVGVTCAVVLNADQFAVIGAMYSDPALIPSLIMSIAVRLAATICVTTILLVAGDLVWSRIRWRTELRMTKQEVKDELKQTEGDPIVKGRLRSIARQRARHRMMASVPQATLVIANPTHYAIALRYDRKDGGAPLVLAKGADLVALKIREIAERSKVPVIEDKPLARALYNAVEVDKWIPAEFYHPVAKLLHYIYAREAHAR